ncbi:MAG TPA: hypothetical protein VJN91_06680 [Gammaproteobacteria bacterium]|nr:hypothetical protein [Gammaproteobacteria bacterium]
MSGTSRRARAVAALLTTRSAVDAAQVAGVSERTIHRWLRDPGFRAQLLEAEGQAVDAAVRRLVHLATSALNALENVLADADSLPGIRLRAAGLVLDHLASLRQLRNVEERLVALEAAMANFEKE